ncbi:dual specificity protein phosphatase family protein [Microseira sp. BLCC-F43]|jgi:protein-tyrosine phosphatase|uniref:dual specificity protein phosphatase family protein n=1 Tax=Microseira sp. BLCC-F43 TaxID=3153602 RepID=UPI0035BB39CD
MKYALTFLIFGILSIIFGWNLVIFRWLFLWTGVSFIIVGSAYGGIGSKVFGKKSNGTLNKWCLFLLLPYLLLTRIIWHIQRSISKEDCCNEIAPGIWLGRRAFVNELPNNISLIIDLTAEFSEPPNVISGKTYICLPTLDTSVPPDRVFQKLIHTICSWNGNVYIHCALGYGRSATVAAGVLLAKGLVDNLNQAEKLLLTARPQIKFSPAQKNMLKKFQLSLQ